MTEEPQHGALDDLWSWIDQEDSVFDVPAVPPSDVTAVMVVTDAAEWLPRQLHALERLDPRPGTIIAVDAASTDDSLALLQAAHEDGVLTRVVEAGERVAFGAAVELALTDTEPEWLWLLHDDSAPHQGALGELLEGARRADVVVPKLLQPKRRNYPETLASASDRSSARLAGSVSARASAARRSAAVLHSVRPEAQANWLRNQSARL